MVFNVSDKKLTINLIGNPIYVMHQRFLAVSMTTSLSVWKSEFIYHSLDSGEV